MRKYPHGSASFRMVPKSSAFVFIHPVGAPLRSSSLIIPSTGESEGFFSSLFFSSLFSSSCVRARESDVSYLFSTVSFFSSIFESVHKVATFVPHSCTFLLFSGTKVPLCCTLLKQFTIPNSYVWNSSLWPSTTLISLCSKQNLPHDALFSNK